MLVWYQKHTQFPGPGRTEHNVVGYPLFPVYMAKAGGFFFIVFGVIALLGGARHDQPDLDVRAVRPLDQVTAGSQPDWYIGFARRRAAPDAQLGDRRPRGTRISLEHPDPGA